MPIPVHPDAHLSACRFCALVFAHYGDHKPVVDHENACSKNPTLGYSTNQASQTLLVTNTGTNYSIAAPLDAFSFGAEGHSA